jgi:hypothetical protein
MEGLGFLFLFFCRNKEALESEGRRKHHRILKRFWTEGTLHGMFLHKFYRRKALMVIEKSKLKQSEEAFTYAPPAMYQGL